MKIKEKSYWIDFGCNSNITTQKAFCRIVNICEAQLIDFEVDSEIIFTETGKKIIVTLKINKCWYPLLITELANL